MPTLVVNGKHKMILIFQRIYLTSSNLKPDLKENKPLTTILPTGNHMKQNIINAFLYRYINIIQAN